MNICNRLLKLYIVFVGLFFVGLVQAAQEQGYRYTDERNITSKRKIAILAYGSLVNQPRNIDTGAVLQASAFAPAEGITLPVSMSRISSEGKPTRRMTLVLDNQGEPRNVYFATSNFTYLPNARNNLAAREGALYNEQKRAYNLTNIFYMKKIQAGGGRDSDESPVPGTSDWVILKAAPNPRQKLSAETEKALARWADNHGYSAIIWASFPPTLESPENGVQRLNSDAQLLRNTYDYVKNLPGGPQTQFERAIVNKIERTGQAPSTLPAAGYPRPTQLITQQRPMPAPAATPKPQGYPRQIQEAIEQNRLTPELVVSAMDQGLLSDEQTDRLLTMLTGGGTAPIPAPAPRPAADLYTPAPAVAPAPAAATAQPRPTALTGTLAFGTSSLKGDVRPTMEDAHAHAVSANGRFEFFGVYDGHAGTEVANALANGISGITSFHQLIFDRLAHTPNLTDISIAQLLKKAVRDYDTQLRDRVDSGSTAIAVLIDKQTSTLYFINLGDARAIVSTNQGKLSTLTRFDSTTNRFVQQLNATADHKPYEDAEAERIRAAGHDVNIGQIEGGPRYGKIVGTRGRLAVSRAFGDFWLKDNQAMTEHMTDADIYMRRLTPDDCCILIACDGLWDVTTNEDMAQMLVDLKQRGDAQAAADAIGNFALLRGSTDNVTDIVIYLK